MPEQPDVPAEPQRRATDWSLKLGPQDIKGFILAAAAFIAAYLWDSRAQDAKQSQQQADMQESKQQAIHARDRELDNLHAEIRDLQGRCRK